MNMKCAICGSDKFHLDVESQRVSCAAACGFYFDFKALLRNGAVEQVQPESLPEPQSQQQRLGYNPNDFEVVGGVLTAYRGEAVDVVVPDGVLEIGVQTFKKMTQIRSVHLPDSLKVIRREAFWGCKNLQRINIPSSVEVLEDSIIKIHDRDDEGNVHTSRHRKSRCFWGCVNLTEIVYDGESLSPYPFQGTAFFQNQKKSLIEREKAMIKEGKCPNCGNTIGKFFKNCTCCGMNWNLFTSKQWGVTRLDIYIDYSLQGDYWV